MVGPRVLLDAVRVLGAVQVPAGFVQVEVLSLYKVYSKVIQGFITLLPVFVTRSGHYLRCYGRYLGSCAALSGKVGRLSGELAH